MEKGFSLKKYKKIHLYWKEEEEYEISHNNIGQLLVTQGEEDISKQCKIVFNFSKEALIGFGSCCIRKSQNFIYNTHVHIEPLGEYLANQGMGFFLTPASSELIVKCESLGSLKELGLKYDSNKILKNNIKYNKFEVDYLVDLDFDNDYFECHNLDFNNIAELKVMKGDQDISKKCRIIFILSKNGMLGLGTQLLRLAHNFNNVDRCLVTPFECGNLNCLLGFFLTPNSAIVEVGCEPFKDVFYYDPSFGCL